jgi:hypothetical protein
VQLPNHDHLVICWEKEGNITTLVANWIPPDNNCPPPAATSPTKKILSGMQHANKIIVKLEVPTGFCGNTRPPSSPANKPDNLAATQKTPPNYLQWHPLPKTFKFDRMLWTTYNDMPLNHKPTTDNIAPAKTPPKELILYALMNQKSTL